MKTKQICAGASLGLALTSVLAANALSQERPAQIIDEQVVVTASRTPKRISEIGKVVRVITAETISRSQGRTLPEVLNNVAGLTIGGNGNNPAEVKSVYLRGANASNTLILIDGIPVNDASEITGEYNISAIPVDQIERVEILKGGNSTLYGSDAVAGVINIILKKGTGNLAASLLSTAGSYDTYKQAIALNGQIGNTSVAINASNLDSKGISNAAPATAQSEFERDAFHQKSASVHLGQQVGDKLLVRSNFQINNNQADLDNGAFTDATDYDYSKSAYLIGLGANYALDRGSIAVNFSRNSVHNVYDNASSITNNKGGITHLEGNLNYAPATFLDIASGISWRSLDTEQRNPFGAPLSADSDVKSLFTSLFFRTASGIQAELGGRVNDHSQYGTNFTYTLNPSFLIDGRYKLFVNLSSAFRTPSLYQLFSEYGNISLEPETSTTYEAGLDLTLSRQFNVAFSWFRRDIESVIDFGMGSAGNFMYINQNQQKDRGFEFELRYNPGRAFDLNAFYAYVNGEITTPSGSSFNLFRRPKHTAGLTAAYSFSEKLSASLIYKFTGDRRDRYFDNSTFTTVDADLGSYSMVDLYAQYKPLAKFMIFADLKNLLDADYRDFAGYTTKGFNVNAGFRLEL